MLTIPDAYLKQSKEAVLIANSPQFLYKRLVKCVSDWIANCDISKDELRTAIQKLNEVNLQTFKNRASAYLLLIAALDKQVVTTDGELSLDIERLQWAEDLISIYKQIHSSSITVEKIILPSFKNVVTSSNSNTIIRG